ncbi:MAG: protein kinase [Labilithrix sp.]|nr:protein kinase [Labilithrix sp.]MCW5814335.1 protein kinase [Labilithrix sp.]
MNVDCGSARDRLGRTLGGKYHLREVLGAGGTAVVYRADSLDGSQVAVKVLHDHLSRSEEVCRRFVREGQLGNVLEHPGTVRVLDHGSTDEGCPYLVLEFLEGESLEERRVRSGGRIDLWETLDYCDQLLAVLEIAHAKSVVHRDIKPSNLFVTKQGRLKVLDFGIARLVDDTSATSTKTGQMVGTPAFMPPEQALSRPRDVDARTDIWSVGATLFTLLSGEHVHIAETSSEHLVKAATLHARSLAKALPGVPANVEGLVARCLSFDKEERWPSASVMRAELRGVRDDPGRRLGTTSAPPPERTPSNPSMPTVIGESSSARLRAVAGPPSSGRVGPPSSGRIGPPSSGRMLSYDTSPTTYSEPMLPVNSDRYIDSVANMALSSNPGAYDLPGVHRRRWLLPLAIGTSALLFTTTIGALVFAFRAPSPTGKVAAAAVSLQPEAAPAPTLEDRSIPPPPEPVAAAEPEPAPEVKPEPPKPALATPPRASAPTTPSTTVAAPKPAASTARPASRKDVYRPF